MASVLLYSVLCYCFRHQRIRSKVKTSGYTTRESMSKMTSAEAQEIVRSWGEYEFPTISRASLQFALFKTYGIPTISNLLSETRMFSTPVNASKRYEDTAVLIGELIYHGPSEERAREAIARMNYLHSFYIKAGKISNEDLLYTLSLFITEPITWINRYEWRQLTEMEICASGTFWKGIGDAMEIRYAGYLKNDTWKDGIEFYEDIRDWARQYESTHLVPASTNKKTADELTPLLLHYIPSPLVPFMRQCVGVLMGEHLRYAMMSEEPSLLAHAITYLILDLRRIFLLNLCLPRIFPVSEFSEKDSKTGRYHHNTYLAHPYYVEATFWNRWGPAAWFTWILGGVLPGGKNGEKYMPGGYLFHEVGPNQKKGKGQEEMNAWKTKISDSRPSTCPFSTK
ncbi:hypothetical protein BGW36DRAFT_298599 [Talaromyces proteolyticus]|uniref:ER-bound oxygenase mpaB/mpaB'/Rubber oxygenase catalytic domain-containing protein n=1 Tax=Talaromyces proteolyticus TaxID=1131652 RepID=A0AAD4KMU5_9EURO|nr:uncharacterized protein BGW36DRAFT_298599 [Talaromyces proteolyticus]KAH8696283.1 hypothetical protein BGW36DRAFT_298599 [Talaromyces proteolyticus]